jgi:hypothetical protein
MKTFTPFQCLWLAAIYILGGLIFDKALVAINYGDHPFSPVAIGGLIAGVVNRC